MSHQTDRLNAALDGRYRILRHLGEGGMASVYMCEDIKHDRKVALKLLKPELAAVLGGERFVQEIRTTAALQHPHILPLFDSGAADGFLFYVMPFIDGETLRARLDRETQLGVDDAVRIAREVADALHYAHERGIVHRDVKPENILLHGGHAMVADFGIALAVSAAAGGRMTETGLSLGTPHYMSPEQATAEKEISARSDVYSIGSVLYEMLTGSPPFTGASAQQIIMKIITTPAEAVTVYRKSVPPNVAAALAKSLEKLPADRFDSAKAFADALANPSFTTATLETDATAIRGAGSPVARRLTTMLGVVAAISLALAAWALSRPQPAAPVGRYALQFDDAVAPAFIGTDEDMRLALTPDGRTLVYVADTLVTGGLSRVLAVRQLGQLEPRILPGTEGGRVPAVSWDGQQVAFRSSDGGRNMIRVVSLAGGPPLTVVDTGDVSPPSWVPDGFIYFFGSEGRLLRVAGSGGPIEEVVTLPREEGMTRRWLRVLPNGRGALVFEMPSALGDRSLSRIRAVDLRDGSVHAELLAVGAEYVPAERALLYVTVDGTLMAVAFDPSSLETRGRPQALFGGIDVRDQAEFALAGNTLIFSTEGTNAREEIVWVDRSSGAETVVDSSWRDPELEDFALSPDGRRLAITIVTRGGRDLWIKQLDRGPINRLTFAEGGARAPEWSADGRFVTFIKRSAGNGSIWRRRADGVGKDEPIAEGAYDVIEARESRDGTWLVASVGRGNAADIYAMRPGADSALRPLLAERWSEVSPALSPDGRWLAYVSNESGTPQVFVRPFPEVQQGRWQLSSEPALNPVWSADGQELFFRTGMGQTIIAADLSRGPSASTRRILARSSPGARWETNYTTQMFAPSPDGRRFLIARQGSGDQSGDIVVVENFTTELRAALRSRPPE